MSDNQPQNQQPEQKPEERQPEKPPVPSLSKQTKQPEHKQPEAPQPIVIQQKGSGGKGLATGALVLSLIALGASGFLYTQGQNVLANQKLQFEKDLNAAALGNSENAAKLESTLQKQAEADRQLAKILEGQTDSARTLDSISRAYAELLKGRVNWLVDEVEVTLNTASQQLLLSGNVPVAAAVLENVEQRLDRFDQPELLPIKQAINRDLTALKNRPYLNISGTALRLDRLESAAESLPLIADSTLTAKNGKPEPVSQAGGFWTRAWDNTAALMKSMVEVRKLDNNDAMLIGPEQVFFVRENLRLRLLDARLALLQHNGDVYQNDLSAVEETVNRYFDTQSPNTQAWLKEVGELKALEIRMVSDDALKASLAAVRNYQNSVRTALPVILYDAIPAPTQTAPAESSTPAAPSAAQTPSPAASAAQPESAAASSPKPQAASHPAGSASAPAATAAASGSAASAEGARE